MTAFNNPNLAILELVAQALGPVCESVIFVGGCATGLLLTLERPDRIRITEDVDIVAQALTMHDYHGIEKQVRAQGFSNDMRPDAPICRWVYKSVTLDLMPTVKDILGFANRWYPLALDTAEAVVLPSGISIRLITAPCSLAPSWKHLKTGAKTPVANQTTWAVMTWKTSSRSPTDGLSCLPSAALPHQSYALTWRRNSQRFSQTRNSSRLCPDIYRVIPIASSAQSRWHKPYVNYPN